MMEEGTYKLCENESDKSKDTNVKNLLPTDTMYGTITKLFGSELDGSKFINAFKKDDKMEFCRVNPSNKDILKCKIMG